MRVSAAAPTRKLCPACGRPVKPGNVYHPGCAYRNGYNPKTGKSGKQGPTPPPRPAIARGIPVALVDALVELLGVDEAAITRDARLGDDLGADSLDLCELSMMLEATYGVILDDADGWDEERATVGQVMRDLTNAGAQP